MDTRISIAGYSFHGALADGTMDAFGYFESCRCRYHLDTADSRIDAALRILREAGYRGALGVEHHSAKNELYEVEAQLAQVRRAAAALEAEAPAAPAEGNPLLDPRNERAHQTMLISEGIYLSGALGREVTADEVRAKSVSTAVSV